MKIVIIGAGSSYTPEIIEGFINRNDSLNISEIALVDIKAGEHKAQIIFELTKRMITQSGEQIKVSLSYDRKSALVDASFVINQLRVGGIGARIVDERTPNSVGLLGQETNGLGGFFKFIRTAPHLTT